MNTDSCVCSQLLKLARMTLLCQALCLPWALCSSSFFHCVVSDPLILFYQGGDFHMYHHRYVHSPQVLDTSYQFSYKPTPTWYSVTSPLVFMWCARVWCVHAEVQGRWQGSSSITCPPYPGSLKKKKIRACQYDFGDPMFLPSEDYHIHQTFMWVSGDACLVSTKTPGPSPQPSVTVFISSLGWRKHLFQVW